MNWPHLVWLFAFLISACSPSSKTPERTGSFPIGTKVLTDSVPIGEEIKMWVYHENRQVLDEFHAFEFSLAKEERNLLDLDISFAARDGLLLSASLKSGLRMKERVIPFTVHYVEYDSLYQDLYRHQYQLAIQTNGEFLNWYPQ